MDKNELLIIKEQLEAQYNSTLEEFFEFFKCTDYYGEYYEGDNEKEAVLKHLELDDFDDLLLYDGKEQRKYDNFQHKLWILERLIAEIEEAIADNKDKKAVHQNKKAIETLISSYRRIKHESKEVIAQENTVLETIDYGLEILDELRNDL